MKTRIFVFAILAAFSLPMIANAALLDGGKKKKKRKSGCCQNRRTQNQGTQRT